MDVTVRASQQGRQSHVQDAQTESEDHIEFGTFFSEFNGAVQGLKPLSDLALPSSELTQGMTSNAEMQDEGSSGNVLVSEDPKRESQSELHDSDDVSTAQQLLSEQRQSKKKNELKRTDLHRESRINERTESDRKQDDIADALRQMEPDSNSNVEQLSADEYAATQTAQAAQLLKSSTDQSDRDLRASWQAKSSSSKQTTVQSTLKGDTHIEQMNEVSKASNEQIRVASDAAKTRSMQGQKSSAYVVNEGMEAVTPEPFQTAGMTGIEGGDAEVPNQRIDRSANTTEQNSRQLDEFSALNISTKSGLTGPQTKVGADTVQLSAKGRTIGSFVGSNTKAKVGLRQDVKAPALARSEAPSRDVEVPEDVDKLSVMSQISDGLKLRFGGNQTFEVNLNPAELGRVRLQLEMQGDKTVNIRVSAEHAVIADLLNLNLNELRKDLLAQGVQVNHIEVDVDAHGQDTEQQDEQQTDPDEHVDNQTENESDDGTKRRQFSVQA